MTTKYPLGKKTKKPQQKHVKTVACLWQQWISFLQQRKTTENVKNSEITLSVCSTREQYQRRGLKLLSSKNKNNCFQWETLLLEIVINFNYFFMDLNSL